MILYLFRQWVGNHKRKWNVLNLFNKELKYISIENHFERFTV